MKIFENIGDDDVSVIFFSYLLTDSLKRVLKVLPVCPTPTTHCSSLWVTRLLFALSFCVYFQSQLSTGGILLLFTRGKTVLSHFHCCLWEAPYFLLVVACCLDSSEVQSGLTVNKAVSCDMVCGLIEPTFRFAAIFRLEAKKIPWKWRIEPSSVTKVNFCHLTRYHIAWYCVTVCSLTI